MKENNSYNKRLKPVVYKLRSSMTKAEACLWKYGLKSKKLGVIFRRQRPVGKYIVDFICLELKIIIEVDGESHNHPEIYDNDIIRQKYLEKLGFMVIRFTDEEVLKSINGVMIILEDIVKNRL
jgi:very-short-patch-repair endonuclease